MHTLIDEIQSLRFNSFNQQVIHPLIHSFMPYSFAAIPRIQKLVHLQLVFALRREPLDCLKLGLLALPPSLLSAPHLLSDLHLCELLLTDPLGVGVGVSDLTFKLIDRISDA